MSSYKAISRAVESELSTYMKAERQQQGTDCCETHDCILRDEWTPNEEQMHERGRCVVVLAVESDVETVDQGDHAAVRDARTLRKVEQLEGCGATRCSEMAQSGVAHMATFGESQLNERCAVSSDGCKHGVVTRAHAGQIKRCEARTSTEYGDNGVARDSRT